MPMTVISSVMAVFTAILGWFEEAFTTASAIFYNAETGLTLIGVCAVLTLGVGIVTLVLGWLRSIIKGS